MLRTNRWHRFALIVVCGAVLLAFGPFACGEEADDEPDDIEVGDSTYEPDEAFPELSTDEQAEICEWFREPLQSHWNACPNDPTALDCSTIIGALDECDGTVSLGTLDRCRDSFDELACAEPPAAAEGCGTVELCLNQPFHGSCSDGIEHNFGDGDHCYQECEHTDECRDDEACTAIDEQGEQAVCAPEDAVETSSSPLSPDAP